MLTLYIVTKHENHPDRETDVVSVHWTQEAAEKAAKENEECSWNYNGKHQLYYFRVREAEIGECPRTVWVGIEVEK